MNLFSSPSNRTLQVKHFDSCPNFSKSQMWQASFLFVCLFDCSFCLLTRITGNTKGIGVNTLRIKLQSIAGKHPQRHSYLVAAWKGSWEKLEKETPVKKRTQKDKEKLHGQHSELWNKLKPYSHFMHSSDQSYKSFFFFGVLPWRYFKIHAYAPGANGTLYES